MIEIGMRYEAVSEVGADSLASSVGSGDMDVLATPAMVALMENAAMRAVESALPEGSTTVGTKVAVSHLRPTDRGERIMATAEVTAVDGRAITFHVSASDAQGKIGEGTHERVVVNRNKFLDKLRNR